MCTCEHPKLTSPSTSVGFSATETRVGRNLSRLASRHESHHRSVDCASLSVLPNWPLGTAVASGASHLRLGNQILLPSKLKEAKQQTFFLLFLFFFFLFGKISQRAVSATSLLLHHSEHCNIIKLVKRKQWCLSFLRAARCSL